jgi:CheY-like chemotaxis protein
LARNPAGCFWEAEKTVDEAEIMKDMENMVEILVADDEPVVAVAIKSALKFCGFTALAVHDGAAALDEVQADPGRFSVVLTDHNMPGLGGIALVKALRAIGYPGGIVILSGYLTRECEAEYKMLGVDQILPKPFSIERLRVALNLALHPEGCPA